MKAPRGWYAVCAAILSGAGLVIAADLSHQGAGSPPPLASGPSVSASAPVPVVPLPVRSTSASPPGRALVVARPERTPAVPSRSTGSASPSVGSPSPVPSPPAPGPALGVTAAVILSPLAALELKLALP